MSFSGLTVQPLSWLITSILCAGIICIMIYLYLSIHRKKWLLVSIRLVIFLLAVFILLQPVKDTSGTYEKKPLVAVLLDTSKSMQINDYYPATRLQMAQQLLAPKGDFIRGLQEKYRLEFYTFDEEIANSSVEDIAHINRAEGENTDIGTALLDVTGRKRNDKLSSVILISDGAHNTGKDPLSSADEISSSIYCIGAGTLEGAKDLAVSEINAGDFAFKDTPLYINVTVKGNGFNNQEIPVMLKKENAVIQTRKVMFNDSTQAMIVFDIKPEDVGKNTYSVEIPLYNGEIFSENNIKEFQIDVLRDKIRILYICGQPSWEYSFLRTVLKTDPKVELVSFLILRNPSNVTMVPENQLSLIPFPVDEIFQKELDNFDLLIFENFTYTRFFPVKYLENIKEFVVNKGKGFLMIGGDNSFGKGGYKDTAIEDILPVIIEGSQEKIEDGLFRMKAVTLTHPVMCLGEDPAHTRLIWSTMPQLDSCNSFVSAKSDAIVLGTHAEKKNAKGNLIVCAVWDKGKGRVMSLASNTTWRWSLQLAGKGKTNYYYKRFWQKAVRWLIKSPQMDLVSIDTSKKIYRKHEPIKATIQVYNEYYKPETDVNLKLSITTPDGRRVDVTDRLVNINEGKYSMTYEDTKIEGNYVLDAVADRGNYKLGKAGIICTLTGHLSEFDEVKLNEGLLSHIAHRTGGEYLPLEQAMKEGVDVFRHDIGISPISGKIHIWNLPVIYMLLCGLLAFEWYIRRKNGMI